MMRSPTITLAMLAAFAATSVQAADPVRAFPGASRADLDRGLPTTAFSPRFLPEREFIESYGFWIQLEDGATLLVSLLVSNLGKPREPAIALSFYPTAGPPVTANVELPPSSLHTSATRLQFGRNSLDQLPDGRYRLRLAAAIKGGGEFTADLTFTPTLPAYMRGDGQVHFGNQGKIFELKVLFPSARVEGHYTYAGRVLAARGQAYGDHTAQNLWAHHIANHWFNYRFFSPDLYVACTSFVTPPRYGSKRISHVLVADREKLLFASDNAVTHYHQVRKDSESGYGVPQEIRTEVAHDGTRIALTIPVPHPLERIYMLADLNALLRAFLRTFIARPYSYRYRTPVTAEISQADGTTRRVTGTFVGELIFVNE